MQKSAVVALVLTLISTSKLAGQTVTSCSGTTSAAVTSPSTATALGSSLCTTVSPEDRQREIDNQVKGAVAIGNGLKWLFTRGRSSGPTMDSSEVVQTLDHVMLAGLIIGVLGRERYPIPGSEIPGEFMDKAMSLAAQFVGANPNTTARGLYLYLAAAIPEKK